MSDHALNEDQFKLLHSTREIGSVICSPAELSHGASASSFAERDDEAAVEASTE
jgi:hypothetical protein